MHGLSSGLDPDPWDSRQNRTVISLGMHSSEVTFELNVYSEVLDFVLLPRPANP
jgi:hypothetical protein